jgi:pimeloyl-ACP methyl ester carboxylesterase
MSQPHLVFSHGLEGAPWGLKITAMAQVARRYQLQVESIDYANMDPAARVARLLEVCRQRTSAAGPVILVGSSLGGHVATAVSAQVATRGLYLLAPAFFMPGYEQYTPRPAACPVTIVHGWNDATVPVENSIRFAREHHCTLHLIDADHRLHDVVDDVCELFDRSTPPGNSNPVRHDVGAGLID